MFRDSAYGWVSTELSLRDSGGRAPRVRASQQPGEAPRGREVERRRAPPPPNKKVAASARLRRAPGDTAQGMQERERAGEVWRCVAETYVVPAPRRQLLNVSRNRANRFDSVDEV